MKIRTMRAELFHVGGRAGRQTDRHDNANSRFSQFCNPPPPTQIKGNLISLEVNIKWSKGINFYAYLHIQGVPGGKVNILGGHSVGNSKQICLYEHVSYSERFPR